MKRSLFAVAVLSLLLYTAAPSIAQDVTGFRGEMLWQIEDVQKKLIDLEGAIPDKKMSWRPAKGVRSISEVYLHVAFGNYLLAKFAGFELPSDITLPDFKEINKWDAATKDKKEIFERMKKSFEFLSTSIKNMPDADLEKEVTFFGQQTSKRNMLMSALAHMHEHLGQSIAYARSIGVVPPWSKGGN
jgi:uncharacterized damage-inducible protein DinB